MIFPKPLLSRVSTFYLAASFCRRKTEAKSWFSMLFQVISEVTTRIFENLLSYFMSFGGARGGVESVYMKP